MAATLGVVEDAQKQFTPSIKSALPQSHLSWDATDMDDVMDDDLFIKDHLQPSLSDSALITNFDTDFKKLTCRSNSTSTPFCNRLSDLEFPRLKSESGFTDCEHGVAQIFAHFCTLKTMENKCSTMSHDFVKLSRRNLKLNEELLPLPKVKLLAEFDAESTDGDSALGDSIHSDIHSDMSMHSHCNSIRSPDSNDFIQTPDLGIVTSEKRVFVKKERTDENIIQSVLEKFSPKNPENIIGRKMGLESVDILSELSYQSVPCVSTILSYLDDKDLYSFSQVNQTWKSICDTDKKCSSRIKTYLESLACSHRINEKENLSKNDKFRSTPKRSKVKSFTTSSRGPLGAVQCSSVSKESSQVSSENVRNLRSQFWEEAQKLKNDESLCKCPKCESPSKVHKIQERGWCQNKNCGLDFCTKCLNPFHGARLCGQATAKRSRTKETVGSKKSKQRLKRL